MPDDIEALKEENKKLRLDVKRLTRELNYERSSIERNKIAYQAKESLSRVISAEKSRLEKYMNLLLHNVKDIVLFFDENGKTALTSTEYLNRSGVQSLGMIRGKSFRELLEPAASEDVLRDACGMFQAALSEKRVTKGDYELDFSGSGTPRSYLFLVTPMLEEDGAAEGTIVTLYDVTDIRQAQRDAERGRELAEQSTRAKSEFLSRMSHEMRTPMNAVIGMAAIARKTGDPARKEYCLERIDEAANHLLGVINDVLDISKIEANKFELSPAEFDFGKMAARVVNVVNFRVDEKRQTLSVDIDGQIPKSLIADEQRLAQVITNLLSNAVKFTPERGSIFFSARKVDERDGVCTLRVEVRDTGIGISEEQQSRLFASFEQADGSISRKYGGTGLGLAISKRIVELMDGRIWIESEIGGGASFIFEILALRSEPRKEPEYPDDTAIRKTPEQREKDSDDGVFSGKTILIAEDVLINQEIVQALIEHTGAAIDFASDGLEAVEKFSAQPDKYALILMDIQMPNLDGYEATERIRASGLSGADSIPIIAMTANVFREDIERCRASGMNDHLGKPIDPDDVLAKLKEYIGKAVA